MRHHIQTNLATWAKSFGMEELKVRHKMGEIIDRHSASGAIITDPTQDRMVVVVDGNGALLRDVVTALDQGGYLD